MNKIKIGCFGHIHIDEKRQIEPVTQWGTTYINASVVDNRYHLIRPDPYYFEIDMS